MSKMRPIAGGVAVLLTALALGHGGHAAEPKAYSAKELQAMYADALRADGYKSEPEGDALKVRASGMTYFVHVYEKNPKYFVINMAYVPDAKAAVEPYLVAGNRMAVGNMGVKYYFNRNGHFVLETGHYLATPEAAKIALPLALADLDDARKEFERAYAREAAPKTPAK